MCGRSPWLLVIALGAALLSGCTTTSAGEAGPAPTSSTEDETGSETTSSPEEPDDLPSDGAPEVTDPFDAGRFEQDPCLALTESQAKALNIGYPGEPSNGGFGKVCDWRNTELSGGRASISFLSDEPRGISSVYRSNNRGELAFFEKLDPLSGYPAVAYGTSDSRKTSGRCAVAVGLSDQLIFIVYLKLSTGNIGHKDPCVIGADVAKMMLTTMGAS
jgi:hypothetical protein